MHVIEPYKNDQCARPRVGKWLACAAMDSAEDWLVSTRMFKILPKQKCTAVKVCSVAGKRSDSFSVVAKYYF